MRVLTGVVLFRSVAFQRQRGIIYRGVKIIVEYPICLTRAVFSKGGSHRFQLALSRRHQRESAARLDLSCCWIFQICEAYFDGMSSHFASDQLEHKEEWRTKLLGGITAVSLARLPLISCISAAA